MTDNQWQEAWKLYRAADAIPAEQLTAFLSAANQDTQVCEAVRQMLSGAGRESDPAVGSDMPDRVGQRIGRYVVTQYLGEGGMGAVYSARDSELGRLVAIKFLPPWLSTADGGKRFAAEAKAASALNHPNIVTIYEVIHAISRIAIAMELIEGYSLRALCGRPSPSDLVLNLGQQIARALAAAHARAIVHCDIKPENIMVRQDGLVKVLDFGLAQDLSSSAASTGAAAGSLRYMSPEQSRGAAASPASDVFSFGIVLYELAAGTHPFENGSLFDTLKALNEADPPPVSAWNKFVPPQLDALILSMLAKEPERRPPAAEVARLLESRFANVPATIILARPATNAPAFGAGKRVRPKSVSILWPRWLTVATLALIAVVAGSLWWAHSGEQNMAFEAVPLTTLQGSEDAPSFSPDGNQVAFRGNQHAQWDIYVKLIGGGPPLRLTSDAGVHWYPAWSPDGAWIAFTAQHENGRSGLFLMPALGGPERLVTELDGDWRSADWSPDGKWIAVSQGSSSNLAPGSGVTVVSVETGERHELAKQDPQMVRSSFGRFSPEGRALAFLKMKGEFGQLYTVDLNADMRLAGRARQLTPAEMEVQFPAWAANGREIIFMRGFASSNGTLARVSSDGGPVRKIAGLGYTAGPIAIARNGGRLAFSRGGLDADIWRLDVSGKEPPQKWIASTVYDVAAEYSPDGKKIVFSSNRSGSREIWVCDADGGNDWQLTHFGGPITGTARWSPDGRWIAFDSRPRGKPDVFVINAEGSGLRRLTDRTTEEQTTNRPGMWQPAWSGDGKWIYFSSDRDGGFEIWRMPWRGGPAQQITHNGGSSAFPSRDNQWVYYQRGQPAPLWRIRADGRDDAMAVNEPIDMLAYTSNASGLYFVLSSARHSVLQRLSQNGEIDKVLDLPFVPGLGLSLSSHADYVLLTKPDEKGTDLMLVEGFR